MTNKYLNNGGTNTTAWANIPFEYVGAYAAASNAVIIDIEAVASTSSVIFLNGITLFPITGSGNEPIYMLVSTDGTNYVVTGYYSGINYWTYNSATQNNANSTTEFLMAPTVWAPGNGYGLTFQVYLYPGTLGGASPSGTAIHGTSFNLGPGIVSYYTEINGVMALSPIKKIKITSASGLQNYGGVAVFKSSY